MAHRLTLAFLSLLFAPSYGCQFVGQVEVPAKLATVLDNTSQFAQDDADPLAGVDAGTVVDDLGNLSGSWSAFWREVGEDPDQALAVAQVLIIDPDAGTLKRYVYHNLAGLMVDVIIQRGDYSVADDGRITFDVTKIEATGLDGAIRDVTDQYARPPQYDVLITRSGDSLKVRFVPLPEDDPRTPAGFADGIELIHQQ